MFGSLIIVAGMYFGKILAAPGVWNNFPFGYHILLSFLCINLVVLSLSKTNDASIILITTPLLIISMGADILVHVIDLIFPPKLQELVPYIDALRTMILSIAQTMADPNRLEAEQALANLGNMSEKVEEIGEGYALRKGIGQGIDIGLTFIVMVGLGVLTFMADLNIPPQIIILFFSTLSLAFATFSGFFGPFYGLFGAAKDFSLRNGNYRGAAFYRTMENAFAVPFMAATAGFIFLDLPPVDAETLDDFRDEMQEQLTEISDNINSLLGKDASAVPRKTRKMIARLMDSTAQSMNTLDFRNIREDTAREFALTYYSHEFSWKPWKRKEAVEEFATNNHFDVETGEQTLKLIGYKIEAGQMDDDMVSNVMISAAMKGVIMMEQKFQELFEDVELGQTCTGLAFGARQFLHDHYIVQSTSNHLFSMSKNLLLGIFAVPLVLMISFHHYANRFFDKIGESFWNQRLVENFIIRNKEISSSISQIPTKVKSWKTRPPKTKEEKAQKTWEIRRKFRKLLSMIWEVIVFPVVVLIGISRWIWTRASGKERNPREMFEEAVAHAALISMYDELYKKLVMQDHVSTAY
jgi:hypothetical protein